MFYPRGKFKGKTNQKICFKIIGFSFPLAEIFSPGQKLSQIFLEHLKVPKPENEQKHTKKISNPCSNDPLIEIRFLVFKDVFKNVFKGVFKDVFKVPKKRKSRIFQCKF